MLTTPRLPGLRLQRVELEIAVVHVERAELGAQVVVEEAALPAQLVIPHGFRPEFEVALLAPPGL
jgi:hypothetical protein